MRRTINKEKIFVAVLVAIMLILNYVIPARALAADTVSSVSNDSYKLELSADREGPYLAGSQVTFTVKVTNLSTKNDINKGNIRLAPSVSNQSIAEDNQSQLQVVSPNDNIKKGTSWSTSFTITLQAGLKSLNDVGFQVDLQTKGDKNTWPTALTVQKAFDVKALEGILITSGKDLGSSFASGGQFHVSYSYKNYNTTTTKYTYKLLLDEKEMPEDKIHWETVPKGKLGGKKEETVKVKIDNDVFASGGDSCVISLVITDENGKESQQDITIAKADVSKITSSLPSGITLDKLYYGSVAKDTTAPFHNAAQLKTLLENSSQSYAQEIWEKYQYDLWDPNFTGRGGCGALDLKTGSKFSPGGYPDYADELLPSTSHEYPKDSNGPFHNSPKAEINPVDATLTDDGVLLNEDEEQFTDLEKTAGPDKGDANKDRTYDIELKATADLKQVKPIALVFQIQTSWQMFDLIHANDRASLVNGEAVNEELLSLYEMKQGFRDFMEWMNDKGNGAVLLGITNFQHGGTHSMIADSSGKTTKHFTNNATLIEQGLNGWDSFGDCEHIHYSNAELQNAIKELGDASNFTGWVDNKGQSVYDKAEIVSVIVGGSCETNDLKENKLLTDIPGKNSGNVKKQYGISTNKGKISDISWMDYENKSGKFDSGKYYKGVTTRQQFFETLKDLYYEAQGVQKVTDVTIEDTITSEFDVNEEDIKAMMGGNDVTKDATIKIEKQADGSTKVSCTFKEITNRSEVKLKIPVTAKEDFIGGNNVKTNTGTPEISYGGRIDKDKTFTQEFEEEPTVNVPVRFTAKDGETETISVGNSVSLKDLAQEDDGTSIITKDVEDWIKKYDQVEGTLTYQWVDEDGNLVGDASSATIDQENRTPPQIPDYTFTGTEKDVGTNTGYKLRITFEPAPVKESSTNKFSVSKQVEEGEVHIKVTKVKEGTVKLSKIVDNYKDSLAEDEFSIQIKSVSGDFVDTSVVLKHKEKSAAITVTEDTVLELSEIVPMEYEYLGFSTGSAEGALQTGNQITVKPGDDITVYLHNKYQWQPYFHDFGSKTNCFKRN